MHSISLTEVAFMMQPSKDLSRPQGGYNPLVFMQHPLTCIGLQQMV